MKISNGDIQYSAHDLIAFANCPHLVAQELAVANRLRSRPSPQSSFLQSLLKLGKEHEANYLKHLRSKGYDVVSIEGIDISEEAVRQTVSAMRKCAQVIYQGALTNNSWGGRVDILLRVEGKSIFGNWSYEAVDVKLANETKAQTILQLCLYSDLLSVTQGSEPEYMYVVPPSSDFQDEKFRVSDYSAYYRRVVRDLTARIKDGLFVDTYPEPVEYCETCRYFAECDKQRRNDDHMCFVAGITRLQIEELKIAGVDTLKTLSEMPLPISWKPSRGAEDGFQRVREQARLQQETRDLGKLQYELLPILEGFGLTCLPEPSSGDLFFDIEGDRFVEGGGMEYLFGYMFKKENDTMEYKSTWAFSRAEEKKAFEDFVDFVMKEWKAHPDMHIYHYAHYEPDALKRLMGRHATREDEVDRMLRADLFVDLFRVVKHSVRAGVESYSIKMLEPLYSFERSAPIARADQALATIRNQMESISKERASEEDMAIVKKYNEDDCKSTFYLREWLEQQRLLLIKKGKDVERPLKKEAAPSKNISDWQAERDKLIKRLTEDIPVDPLERADEQKSRWLLANVLDWYRREEKPKWWEYFRLLGLSEEELLDEKASLSGLGFVETGVSTEGKAFCIYKYPLQETSVQRNDSLRTLTGEKFGKVSLVSYENRKVNIEQLKRFEGLRPSAVISHNILSTQVLQTSLARIAQHVADTGMEDAEEYQVARDLLLRRKFDAGESTMKLTGSENTLSTAIDLCNSIKSGVLPIQGPPGSGKTYTAAHMVCEYAKRGKKVGITANSHKVIENLLSKAIDVAQSDGLQLRCCKKNGNANKSSRVMFDVADDNKTLMRRLTEDTTVGAATAWFWSRAEVKNLVDVLFVDEAAQMSLASVLAISHAANVMILLGDPQQLSQPMQGSHPEGTEVSAMKHIVGDQQTISKCAGLFLDETWRLHPSICRYTSEMFYDNRLLPKETLKKQKICGKGSLSGSGLRYCMVEHQGNVNSSLEEANAVSRIVSSILEKQTKWIDGNGSEKRLTVNDILIIAPYNAQVIAILDRLPKARVGTVDKFQGQEAPIAIYSTATSSGDLAPRGMEFLYDLNRLNVATSRAKCMSILVSSPLIFEVNCRTPGQMKLANAFCRYLETASELRLDELSSEINYDAK